MLHQGTLTPAYDKKFWMYILKSVGNDVKAQTLKTNYHIQTLKAIKTNSLSIQEDLGWILDQMKTKIVGLVPRY